MKRSDSRLSRSRTALASGASAVLLGALTLSLALSCRQAPEPEWPRWRGPGGLGIADGEALPVHWSADSANVRWITALPGSGNSSPVVSRDRVYLTTAFRDDECQADESWRAVLSLDLDSGELLWETKIYKAPTRGTHRINTVAAPTPVSDGESVFAYFGSVLARVDRNGKLRWQTELEPSFRELSHYGAASSPVLIDGAVVVVQDQETSGNDDVGWIAAFERDSGEQLWRTEWDDTCCAYSTPLVLERGGGEEIVFAHSGRVVGYEASSGKELWRHPYEINQIVSSPVVDGDILAISGGAHNVKRTVFLRLSGFADQTATELVWEELRLVPQTSSPVLYNGLFFTVTDQGFLAAYQAENGTLLWRQRLPRSKTRSSIVAGDGKIYVSSRSGWVFVVSAAPQFELLGENTLGEPGNNASPAVAGGCFLLRTESHLACIEGGEEETAAAQPESASS